MGQPYGYGKLWYMHGPFRPAPATLGYQLEFTPRDIYRKGIPAADQAIQEAFGKRFVDLDPAGRDQAITRLEAGTLKLSPVPAETLFGEFLKNTQEGYFSDPIHGGNRGMAAWKMIGFPGARADYTDWVDRYGAKYPFGPVSIKDLGA
jgi:gluconate 2-dehydrogenase gamma chain